MRAQKGNLQRTDRLNGEFQKAISEIISRKLKNPYITEMCSVLGVETSKDLKYAKVFISVYSKDEEKKMNTFHAIESEGKRIRYELAKTAHTRTVPELHFVLDDTLAYGDRMDKLLKSIEIKEDEQ